jgi:tRNA pseudouridine38-40 synthase
LEARNLKLTVEYDGTAYFGWQAQGDHPSVQDTLESAAARVVDHPVVIHGSGRTDRGVHAVGQTANFKTPKAIPAAKLLLGINTYLPDDIRVREVEEVPADFHARYSARGKRYRYTVLRSPVDRVLARRFSARFPGPLDIEAMGRAAGALAGVHDFRSFEGRSKRSPPAPGEPPRSTVRTVIGVTVRESGPFLTIDAFGRGFLYGMVRAIAGTLLEVGTGKRAPDSLEAVLASRDRRQAGFTAPARGLCLLAVYYEDVALEAAFQAALAGGEDPDSAAVDHLRCLKLFI